MILKIAVRFLCYCLSGLIVYYAIDYPITNIFPLFIDKKVIYLSKIYIMNN